MLSRPAAPKLVVPTLMVLVMLPILVALGFWQLERLAWKEALIAEIEARTKAAPVDIETVRGLPDRNADTYEYTPVRIRGRFHHDKELYLYAPDPASGPGVEVITPFEAASSGAILLVNRGYVPDALKAPEARRAGQMAGPVEIVGLLRPPGEQGTFTPANDARRNLWFWRDFEAMARSAFGEVPAGSLGVFVDALEPAPGGWPKGGATRLDLPNRHLEYALTWFGLAAALVVVYLVYAFPRLRRGRD